MASILLMFASCEDQQKKHFRYFFRNTVFGWTRTRFPFHSSLAKQQHRSGPRLFLCETRSALVAGANAKARSQIEKPGCVANALSITRFPRWRARSRNADVVRAPAA